MRIDAHQHFWRLEDRGGGWPGPELGPIHRDFLPEDLRPLLEARGVVGTVLVQTLESETDTAWMLDLAARNEFVLGVVGWTEMKAVDAPEAIAHLAGNVKLRGLRPMLQGLAEDGWIDDPALDAAVAAMIDHGLVFDALVMPRHLAALGAFARRHPALGIVIDHGAKPEIARGHFEAWRGALTLLADMPNVRCKLSGLLIEAGDLPMMATRPYAETILALFGAERVIWGSDWPVLRLAGDYAGWLDFCAGLVPEADHAAVFGGNAAAFYGLDTSHILESSGATC